MGNSEKTRYLLAKQQIKQPPLRQRNSYSLNQISFQPNKISGSYINNISRDYDREKHKQETNHLMSGNSDYKDNKNKKDNHSEDNKQTKDYKDKKLSLLTSNNDELRNKLIKISKQLSERLQKKKIVKRNFNVPFQKEEVPSSLKRQLENGYRQIDMYKKRIEDIKLNGNPETMADRVQRIQNSITAIDNEIELYINRIKGLKNVEKAQEKGIKEGTEMQYSEDKYLEQIQQHKLKIKMIKKKQREREPKQKRAQDYMYQLEKKIRQVKGEYYPEGKINSPKEQKKTIKTNNIQKVIPTSKELGDSEAQLAILHLKHDQLKKKMSISVKAKGQIIAERENILKEIKTKDPIIQGLRAKKDILLAQIKTFGNNGQEEELSQFQQEDDQEQEDKSSNVFGVDHLKAQIKKPKLRSELGTSLIGSQDKSQPKKWEKKLTRILEKGASKKGQKNFNDTEICQATQTDLVYIIGVNIWLNKQKRLLGLQAVYLIGTDIKLGHSSSRNEEQYLTRYQLAEGDYIKSIVGHFGASGFLQYLMLRSKKGIVGKYGRQPSEGERLACGLSENQIPIILSGSSSLEGESWRLNRLSVEVSLSSL